MIPVSDSLYELSYLPILLAALGSFASIYLNLANLLWCLMPQEVHGEPGSRSCIVNGFVVTVLPSTRSFCHCFKSFRLWSSEIFCCFKASPLSLSTTTSASGFFEESSSIDVPDDLGFGTASVWSCPLCAKKVIDLPNCQSPIAGVLRRVHGILLAEVSIRARIHV